MPVSTYTAFHGGLNEQIGPVISEPDQSGLIPSSMFYADSCRNWECSESGLIKMAGVASVLSAALPDKITGLFRFSDTEFVVTCAIGKVYSVIGSTATEIYAGATINTTYTACMFRGAMLLMNGADTPLRYDGVTCSAISYTDPSSLWLNAKPKAAFVFRNNLYYLGDSTNKSRLYKPNPYSIGGSNGYSDFTFSSGGVEVVDVIGVGDLLGGVSVSEDFALLFKTDSLIRMSGSTPLAGSDPIKFYTESDRVGCVSGNTILPIDNDIYFLAKGGLKQISKTQRFGGIQFNDPTYNILPTTFSGANMAALSSSVCGFLPKTNSLYLSYPIDASSTNNMTICYDLVTGTCQPMTGIVPTCFCERANILYFGGTDGQVYKMNSGYAYGANNIDAYWASKMICHGGVGVLKRYREAHIFIESIGPCNLVIGASVLRKETRTSQAHTHSVTSESLWDSVRWDNFKWAGGQNGIAQMRNLGRGYGIAFAFQNNNNTEQPKIRQITLKYDIFQKGMRD